MKEKWKVTFIAMRQCTKQLQTGRRNRESIGDRRKHRRRLKTVKFTSSSMQRHFKQRVYEPNQCVAHSA